MPKAKNPNDPARMILRAFKIVLLLLWVSLNFALAWLAKRAKRNDLRDRISCVCHAGTLRIVGVHLHVRGQLTDTRPLLLVTNHVSYLDVAVLGSVFPFRFTPKQEIASWPGISALCRVSDAVFVERRPEKLAQATLDVQQALGNGQVICLFPEATTGMGVRLLPFKPGFFRLAETGIDGRALTVQPAAVAYRRLCNLPIDSSQWPDIAWYGDMSLLPHLWKLLGLGRIDAELIFLPPVTLANHGDRKQLARHCEQAISEAIQNSRGEGNAPAAAT